ncbi:synaptic vesicle 2-related protein-like [Artemia franciscana]|uniref:Major facilitator superfamily (MFS) profile domain-containing protein n=1 Tax=Artemia franciscana TaxID=6661 RepID=A0AA88L0M2_ARTSF|nr:hypothetical protein QYM36_014119 [Artemia franciscana]KAK2708402.1 hypothetical protein QYM36_014119 [Artemia franciscana]
MASPTNSDDSNPNYERIEDIETSPEPRVPDQPLSQLKSFNNPKWINFDTASGIEMSAVNSGVVSSDSYTVEEAINSFGFGKYQVRLALITGLCWMFDSIEVTILAILSPTLHCSWKLPHWKQAIFTSLVFFGMLVSTPFWSLVESRFGKKVVLTLSSVFLAVYAFLSSFAPTFFWLIFLRMLVGFCIGSVPQSVTLFAEYLPVKHRNKCVILLDCFWTLGACVELLLAMVIMPLFGWRWLLGISILPVLLFACFTRNLPESSKFHVLQGRTDAAVSCLKRVAQANGQNMIPGRLVQDDFFASEKRGAVSDLFLKSLRKTTLLLWFIWLCVAFCYYGIVLLSAELLRPREGVCYGSLYNTDSCRAYCSDLDVTFYVDLLWTTLSEFPGTLFTIVILDFAGRRKTIAIQIFLYSIFVSLLFICFTRRLYLTVILSIARGVLSGIFQALYVYTPDIYPESLRSVILSTCSTMARLGAILTPFVAQLLIYYNMEAGICVYTIIGLITSLTAFLLPNELKSRENHAQLA